MDHTKHVKAKLNSARLIIVSLTALILITSQSYGYEFLREWWLGIEGSIVDNPIEHLTSDPDFPDYPTGSEIINIFETPYLILGDDWPDWANNYGQRVSGLITPPQTGDYIFWIASDDQSQLRLSSDENPSNNTLIAYVDRWTEPHQWDKYPSQQSTPIFMEAGQQYYIEALHIEGGGGDHLSVAWQLPDGTFQAPIPEPTSILLLTFGSLLLMKKKCK